MNIVCMTNLNIMTDGFGLIKYKYKYKCSKDKCVKIMMSSKLLLETQRKHIGLENYIFATMLDIITR